MIGAILLFGVIGWLAWPYISDLLVQHRQDDRILEKIMQRRYLAQQAPHSPAAHEQLGDALREGDKLQDAIAAYEKAIELEEQQVPGGGAGYIGGGGVEHKLRLTRMELAERQEPEKHGQTLRTRQQVCSQCANLANPGDRICQTCGMPLPVDTLWDTIRDPDMRKIIVREGREAVIMLSVVTLALWFMGTLRLEVRLVVFFAACIVIANRTLKRIGPDG